MENRNVFEQDYLPNLLYTKPYWVMNGLLNRETTVLQELSKTFAEERGLIYNLPENSKVSSYKLDENTICFFIEMGNTSPENECYRIYIFFNKKDNCVAYYTAESGLEPFEMSPQIFLCANDPEKGHINFGYYNIKNKYSQISFEMRFFYATFNQINDAIIPAVHPFSEKNKTGKAVIGCPVCKKRMCYDLSNINDGDKILLLCLNCWKVAIAEKDGDSYRLVS